MCDSKTEIKIGPKVIADKSEIEPGLIFNENKAHFSNISFFNYFCSKPAYIRKCFIVKH